MAGSKDIFEDLAHHEAASGTSLDVDSFRLRSYQAEMVEESLKSNIICVMDTGSGKTHIAIERTRLELEQCPRDKLFWFLAPTVTLCEQQYEVFRNNLHAYGIQIFSGKDNVDHWTDQKVWDAVLHNIRIVLSTHQVLLDALTHGFVKIDQLALLIYDEAHHCVRDHPARRIMRDFYVPMLDCGSDQVPKILGLSASPVMNAKASAEDLQQIEQNLCATARTPKLHRTELMQFVHMPLLTRVVHPVEASQLTQSGLMTSLKMLFETYDMNTDPWVVELLKRQEEGHNVSVQIEKAFLSGKTYCYDQIKSLAAKTVAMSQELGISPAEWYVGQCIAHFQELVRKSDYQLAEWSVDEKRHLMNILQRLPKYPSPSMALNHVSQKVDLLIDVLVGVAAANPDFTGLVFVEQRVWIAALAEILSQHPRTKDLFHFGTFTGTSQSSKRKMMIAALAEPKNQQSTLEDFRAGNINLILATSVLEEGIDISNCHLVICFERPKNLKSFVQRRGRARMQQSQYVIFIPEIHNGRSPESWQSLEEEMKAAYLDDSRQVRLAQQKELEDEEGQRFFRIGSTGALLTLDNASQHLHHFCAILSSGPYIDTRPQFDFTENDRGFITARVTLPISVAPALRTATGIDSWRTERMAKKDVAFEAYKALYMAGLVNDNLLPAKKEIDPPPGIVKLPNQPSLVSVAPTFDPWPMMAQVQQNNPGLFGRTLLSIHMPGAEPTHMLLFTTTPMPAIQEIVLFWNEIQNVNVKITAMPSLHLQENEIQIMKKITFDILRTVHEVRMQAQRTDFLWMLIPCDKSGILDLDHTMSLLDGNRAALGDFTMTANASDWGLISQEGDARRYIAKEVVYTDSVSDQGLPQILLRATLVPKRRDFLHPVVTTNNTNYAYMRTEDLDASKCTMESVPVAYPIFALLFPSILYRLEVGIVAQTLMTTTLEHIKLDTTHHLPIIIRALTSSSTGEGDNYQRLEFLGDCILKFITTVHLMAKNPLWPEGHLTAAKGNIVSNGYLARASLAAGLNIFIITKRFTGAKWQPMYIDDLLADTGYSKKEERSSKTIADVIEALIGATYDIGGVEKAFACVEVLLPTEPWTSISSANSILYDAALSDEITSYDTLETLIGHSFSKKMLLLEALTHASYTGPHALCSYERLEFLGDAVLDYIVSTRLYFHDPPLSHQKMHGIRTAMVNASFLAFRMLETTVSETIVNKATMLSEEHQKALWQFLRSSSLELNMGREAALRQHAESREQVLKALEHDKRFPWHLLALTDAPKVLSDIVESVIGAIYIDSHGSIASCETFVRRLGILDCLDRILRDEVDCLHPKERLGHLAVERKVQYLRVKDVDDAPTSGGLYRCQVQVGGQDVGGVVEGLKRLSAETMAACKACAILEQPSDIVMDDGDENDIFFDADAGGGGSLDTAEESVKAA